MMASVVPLVPSIVVVPVLVKAYTSVVQVPDVAKIYMIAVVVVVNPICVRMRKKN